MKTGSVVVLWCMLVGELWGQSQPPVVMLFAGDVTLARHIETAVGDRTLYVFQYWKNLPPYDVFMVNLENAVTTSEDKIEKEFNFKMPSKYLDILRDGGVNIVNVANNHVADYGRAGIDDTIRNLDSAGISFVGIGKNLAEARRPVIKTIKGKKIGFLGYHGGNSFAATSDSTGIAPRFGGYIVADVKRLRPRVDFLVVNFHWGTEKEIHPEPSQIELAHEVVEAGADLIIGHHPHVLQGVERYHNAVIAYSLGNFVFGGNSRHTYETAVIKVTLSDKAPTIELLPVRVERWQPKLAKDEIALSILDSVRARSAIFHESLVLEPVVER